MSATRPQGAPSAAEPSRSEPSRSGSSRGILRGALYWLEPRWRDPGWLAFALNRFAGLVLVAYLLVHMVVLARLADGPAGWDSLLELFGSTPFLVGDALLVAAIAFHGLNGLRVIALTAGWGVRRPLLGIGAVFVASGLLTLAAAWMILA